MEQEKRGSYSIITGPGAIAVIRVETFSTIFVKGIMRGKSSVHTEGTQWRGAEKTKHRRL